MERKRRSLTQAISATLLLVVVLVTSCIPNPPPNPIPPPSNPIPIVTLHSVEIIPETITLAPGSVQQFLAKAYDIDQNEIPDITLKWTLENGGGEIFEKGVFIAGASSGSYKDTVQIEATYQGISKVKTASVTVIDLPAGQELVHVPTMADSGEVPPSAPSGYVVFSDTFNGWNQGWPLSDDVHFNDESLLLEKSSDKNPFSSNWDIPKTDHFACQVELCFQDTEAQTHGVLGLEKGKGTIYFSIMPVKHWVMVYSYDPEEGYTTLVNITYSESTNAHEEENKLLVIGRDSSLEFYVNSHYITSYVDPYPASPLTGINLSVRGEESTVAYDNVLLFSLVPLPTAVVNPPTTVPMVNFDMAATKRIFTVYAFLNVVGYDGGIDGWGFTPMRIQIRDAMAGIDPNLIEKMKDHYKDIGSYGWADYALTLTGEGPFQETSRTQERTLGRFDGTISVLNEFYIKGGLDGLWQMVEPDYLGHAEVALPQVESALSDVYTYLHQSSSSDIHIYYVPNWLDRYSAGRVFTYDNERFIVMTRASSNYSFKETIRHELLHIELDDVLDRNKDNIEARIKLFPPMPEAIKKSEYQPYSYFFEECLVRAITVHMAVLWDPAQQPYSSRTHNLGKFFLIEPIMEALQEIETSTGDFEQNFSKILQVVP